MELNQLIHELCLCAIEQGYATDLHPLYKNPVIGLGLYYELAKIAREDESVTTI